MKFGRVGIAGALAGALAGSLLLVGCTASGEGTIKQDGERRPACRSS